MAALSLSLGTLTLGFPLILQLIPDHFWVLHPWVRACEFGKLAEEWNVQCHDVCVRLSVCVCVCPCVGEGVVCISPFCILMIVCDL